MEQEPEVCFVMNQCLCLRLYRLCVPGWVWPGHPQTAGREPVRDPEKEMVGRWKVSKRRGPSSQRWRTDWHTVVSVCLRLLQLLMYIGVCFMARTWHGEHRWDLCSPGVWPVNCHPHGCAGVCMDAASHSRNRGERGLFYLPLLCVLLPGHPPPLLSPFPCPQPCPALHLTAHTPQSLPHTGAFSPLACTKSTGAPERWL